MPSSPPKSPSRRSARPRSSLGASPVSILKGRRASLSPRKLRPRGTVTWAEGASLCTVHAADPRDEYDRKPALPAPPSVPRLLCPRPPLARCNASVFSSAPAGASGAAADDDCGKWRLNLPDDLKSWEPPRTAAPLEDADMDGVDCLAPYFYMPDGGADATAGPPASPASTASPLTPVDDLPEAFWEDACMSDDAPMFLVAPAAPPHIAKRAARPHLSADSARLLARVEHSYDALVREFGELQVAFAQDAGLPAQGGPVTLTLPLFVKGRGVQFRAPSSSSRRIGQRPRVAAQRFKREDVLGAQAPGPEFSEPEVDLGLDLDDDDDEVAEAELYSMQVLEGAPASRLGTFRATGLSDDDDLWSLGSSSSVSP